MKNSNPKFFNGILILCLICICLKGNSQEKNLKIDLKFGKVELKDFELNKYKVDTSFGAVVIADIGQSSFEGNQKGWFNLVFRQQERIKILNKKGNSLANVEIPIYFADNDNSEKIIGLRASTYNIENGLVVETKLNKDAIFTEKIDDHHYLKKFTFPNVKDGSILEYSYTLNSDFLFNLQPWEFQSTFPKIWSEYSVDIPNFFIYIIIAQGYLSFDQSTKRNYDYDYKVTFNGRDNFSSPEISTIRSNNTEYHWVIKNVPAFKEEKFTSTIKNHIQKIEFQLSGEKFPNSPYHDLLGSWESLSTKLMQREDFGYYLNRENPWLNEDLKPLIIGTSSNLEKANKIYTYIQSRMKQNDYMGLLSTHSLKDSYKINTGSPTEINLLLVASLKHFGLVANPLILSTRSHGFTSEIYPLLGRFNYTICEFEQDGLVYLLDASKPYLSFGRIPSYCYNGMGKVLKETAESYYLSPDSIKDGNLTNVLLFNSPKNPGKWVGNLQKYYGYFSSDKLREEILKSGLNSRLLKIQNYFKDDIHLDSLTIEDLKDLSKGCQLNAKVLVDVPNKPNIIYFPPIFFDIQKENPFSSSERKYPIEMPNKTDEIYSFQIQIPEGYKVDELPKSTKISLNGDEGYFEYLISADDNEINLRTRLKINKAIFQAEDYETLRSFYDIIVKKHAEQIVFKKL